MSKGYFAEFENVFMCLMTYFLLLVLFKIYFKSLILRFEIFSGKTLSVTPVFTTLILLFLFQIIKIRQCCGFTFTNFFCFLLATNALMTSWVTLVYFLYFSYFLIWFSHVSLMEISSTHVYFRSRTIMLCLDNKKQKDKNTFKYYSQSEYFIY